MTRLNYYLKGKNIAPRLKKEAEALAGTRVRYLRSRDIDRSGRGCFFPQVGTVERAIGRDVVIDGDYVSLKSIIEMERLPHDRPPRI